PFILQGLFFPTEKHFTLSGHLSYDIDFIEFFGHNDPYNRIYSTTLKGDAYENVLPKSQG
ncbi:hypothetical protein, partial [uncultured Acidaminococcus sp.]|uniref:hypothetical protein n=1 Tax=uncultured Acidaminococcus sp. TaxID=352152 RepID=UPI00260E0ECA